MGTRSFKPTSPGRRFMTISDFEEVTPATPEKSLLAPVHRTGGRNNNGRITTRHQGGGHKRRYRIIDFKRTKDGVPATVASIEYDPNRTARIALLHYADGAKAYIIAPQRLTVGATVQSGADADIRPGNALPLSAVPVGTTVHAVELRPGQGARMCRSAGTSAQLVAKEAGKALLRLPSGELRRVAESCRATIGAVGNADAPERVRRQGRPGPLAGPAPGRPWHRHEPGRPPARRWRGQDQGLAPGHPVGQADARPPHPQSQEGLHRGDRPRTQAWQGQEVDDE